MLQYLFILLLLPIHTALADYSFLLRDKRYPERPFTVHLPASNRAGTKSFETYLVKGNVTLDQNGNPEIGVVNGPLIYRSRSVQHDWNFALDGSELEFSDFTIELCDGQFKDIEQDPDYWFGTVGQFCPWNTRGLVDEVRKNGKLIFLRM